MKIYISGPITHMPIKRAKANFEAAEMVIISKGHEAINPMTLRHDHGKTWSEYMREDIVALMACDAVIVLPKWEKSKGCNIEIKLAMDLEIPNYVLPEDAKNIDLLNAIEALCTKLSC